MRAMKIKFFVILLLSAVFQITAQQKLTPKATVSVVTCGPGEELYTAFGHSAFRIFDPISRIDKIYNYGTFNFNAPNFYLNFAKGNLIYQLSTTNFSYFLRAYQYENRWVKTQTLDLTPQEVLQFYEFLENNAKPENRLYRYDFFYDNCATKIEDVIKAVLKDKVVSSNSHITSEKTHRDLIADYTKQFSWGKFGIDLALGSVIDKKANKDDYKFLPDYIFKALENTSIKRENTLKPLVKKTTKILGHRSLESKNTFLTPFLVFFILSVLLLWLTYKDYKQKSRNRWVDFGLYFTTGIIGSIVLLLWFATSHTATYKNYNFLWAFAPNFVVSFYMLKQDLPKWITRYNSLLLVLLVVTILFWVFQIQVFNTALIPFFVVLAVRYILINLSTSKK